MRIGLAMARRVSALVTVTAASSGSCPSLEFVSFIVEDSFPSPPIIYKLFVQYICTLFCVLEIAGACHRQCPGFPCDSTKERLFWSDKQTNGGVL